MVCLEQGDAAFSRHHERIPSRKAGGPRVPLTRFREADFLQKGHRAERCWRPGPPLIIRVALKSTVHAKAFSLNFGLRGLCALRSRDVKTIAMLTTNVDDLLYGSRPEGGAVVQSDRFQVSEVEPQNCRFCGKECIQVTVTARNNTSRIGSVTYEARKKLDTPCGEAEIAQLRSVFASLSSIAR